jgi:hypothetical protein
MLNITQACPWKKIEIRSRHAQWISWLWRTQCAGSKDPRSISWTHMPITLCIDDHLVVILILKWNISSDHQKTIFLKQGMELNRCNISLTRPNYTGSFFANKNITTDFYSCLRHRYNFLTRAMTCHVELEPQNLLSSSLDVCSKIAKFSMANWRRG